MLLDPTLPAGKVSVDGRIITKAGTPVAPGSKIVLAAEEPKYVCRAGHKLEAALDHFGVDVTGLACLDSGQSTGEQATQLAEGLMGVMTLVTCYLLPTTDNQLRGILVNAGGFTDCLLQRGAAHVGGVHIQNHMLQDACLS